MRKKKAWIWPPAHPAAALLPMMSDKEINEVALNIQENGLQVPIDFWEENYEEANGAEGPFRQFLLEGRTRAEAVKRLIGENSDPRELRSDAIRYLKAIERSPSASSSSPTPLGLPSGWIKSVDPVEHVLSMNIHRRHLTAKQKRAAIDALIKAKPQASDHAIAKAAHADDKTVRKVRKESVPNSEIPKMEHRPIERAKEAVRANPRVSVSEIAKASNVGRATAQKAKKLVAIESNPETKSEPEPEPEPIDSEQELKKKVERLRAAVRKAFAALTPTAASERSRST